MDWFTEQTTDDGARALELVYVTATHGDMVMITRPHAARVRVIDDTKSNRRIAAWEWVEKKTLIRA